MSGSDSELFDEDDEYVEDTTGVSIAESKSIKEFLILTHSTLEIFIYF